MKGTVYKFLYHEEYSTPCMLLIRTSVHKATYRNYIFHEGTLFIITRQYNYEEKSGEIAVSYYKEITIL